MTRLTTYTNITSNAFKFVNNIAFYDINQHPDKINHSFANSEDLQFSNFEKSLDFNFEKFNSYVLLCFCDLENILNIYSDSNYFTYFATIYTKNITLLQSAPISGYLNIGETKNLCLH